METQKALVQLQQLDAWDKVGGMFLEPYNIVLVLFLVGVGIVLKGIHKMPDWTIIFAIPVLGSVFGILLLTLSYKLYPVTLAMMIGSCDGVFAVFGHQVIKQVLESPMGATLMQYWPVKILAVLVGAAPQPPTPVTPPTVKP